MTSDENSITFTWGRDYGIHGRYGFWIYRGETLILSKGGFVNSTAAKRAGYRAASKIAEG